MDRKPNKKLPHRTKSGRAPSDDSEASPMTAAKPQSLPSLEELAKDPARTHRTWYPKYGRVQKCDYCNGRSEGTLHVCSDCSVRICVHCARNRSWAVHRSRHFIDVDACNWAVRKPPKPTKPVTQRGSKRPAQSPPDNAPSGPAARRRKLEMSRSRADDNSDDEDDSEYEEKHLPNSRVRPTPRSAPVVGRGGIKGGESHIPLSSIPLRQASHRVATPRVAPQTTPITRSRPNPRLAASRALLGMSEYTRRSSYGSFAEDDADEHDDPEYDDQGDDDEDDVYENRGNAETNPRRYPSNRLAVNTTPQVRADRARGPSPEPRASGALVSAERPPVTAEDEERDNLIKDIYYWIYGTHPSLSHYRMRSKVPDIWEGDRLAAYNRCHGKEQSSYHDYTGNSYNPPSAAYHPTSRTTPSYHPHNDRTPAEVEELQQDRQTLEELQDAWIHHPELARMAGNGAGIGLGLGTRTNAPTAVEPRPLYAIQVLWDVLEARRARVLLRDDSQTVRWFVAERDRQFRIEHSVREGRSVVATGAGSGVGWRGERAAGRDGDGEGRHGKDGVQE